MSMPKYVADQNSRLIVTTLLLWLKCFSWIFWGEWRLRCFMLWRKNTRYKQEMH